MTRLALFAAALLASTASMAQDALTMSAVRYAQEGYSTTSVTFHPNVAGHIDVKLACGGRSYALNTDIAPGKDHQIPFDGLKTGSHTCRGSLALRADDGTTGDMPLSIQVQVLPPLKLEVSKEELDLDERTLTVRSDRALTKVEIVVLGEGGAQVGQGTTSASQSEVFMQWSQQGGEAIKIEVTAYDEHGLPGKLELLPWSYDIPHEDVVFATGQHAIESAETPKLDGAYAELQGVLAKYGSVVEVQLFVTGYTDTMGAAASNLALSDRRARSIAQWFRNRGFGGAIYYQGFGESVLAEPTADSVDSAVNRRATYLLAAERPALSTNTPRANWKRL